MAGPAAPAVKKFEAYEPAPGVVPAARLSEVMACDSSPYNFLNNGGISGQYMFLGYPALAELAQVPEYRKMGSIIAEDMVREGIEFRSKGDGDKADQIGKIDEWFRQHNVMGTLQAAIERDAWFGRCQVYIDVKKTGGALASEDPVELATPLALVDKKIAKGSFAGLRLVEPVWSYPGIYNSTNPLGADYYRPSTWFVMGKEVHRSRLLTLISNPVPDILKAAYSFGGVPLIQLARPYVDNWLRTRQSVSDVVHSFSTSGILTNLETLLQTPMAGDGEEGDPTLDVIQRVLLFNKMRDNRGCMVLDKESEEFFQVNTPLAGLDKLQAQSQEHMSAVSQTPLVKLTGITPAGLNASSDGEIRVWYDRVGGYCKNVLGPFLKRVLELAQLSLDGTVDEHLAWEWNPLHELTALEEADRRSKDATTAAAYIEATVITPEQEAERLANDPTSGYAGILNRPASPDDFEDTDIDGIVNELLEPMAEEAANGTPDAGQTVQDPSPDTLQPPG